MPAGLLAGLIKNKKRVFDAHEYFSEVPEVYDRKLIKKLWELIAQTMIPHYHKCYTVGECLAGIFTKIHKKEFATIRNVPIRTNPVPVTKTWVNTNAQSVIILYQGALNAGRGIESAILAMKQIDFAELWLAGQGDLSENLRKLAAENGLGSRVKLSA